MSKASLIIPGLVITAIISLTAFTLFSCTCDNKKEMTCSAGVINFYNFPTDPGDVRFLGYTKGTNYSEKTDSMERSTFAAKSGQIQYYFCDYSPDMAKDWIIIFPGLKKTFKLDDIVYLVKDCSYCSRHSSYTELQYYQVDGKPFNGKIFNIYY